MNYLFFVGNKRCGTTLMVNLLNLHPDIFVSHESDLIWILCQIQNFGRVPQRYEWDGWLGMSKTLEASSLLANNYICENYKLIDPAEKFRQITLYLMTHGNEIQRRYNKTTLKWIGDKKPVQCCDPSVRPFLLEHFPNAKYLHMVRNPMPCVASKIAAGERAVLAHDTRGLPPYWLAPTECIVDRWIIHEHLALKVEEESPTYRLLLEDLCYAPVMYMQEVFRFLGLDTSASVCSNVRQMVEPGPNTKYDTSHPIIDSRQLPAVRTLMEEYGYD